MLQYLSYWRAMLTHALVGSKAYYLWLGALGLGILGGAIGFQQQTEQGLIVTNLSDQVSWGAYIANFTYMVGVAAASVLLVVPSYIYKRADIKEVVLIGELIAVSAIVMCIGFVVVDLGHPERAIHMVPGFGRLNFPRSMLAWDIVVLNGYLILNLHIPGYLLYQRWRGNKPRSQHYLPLVFVSIAWAVSIHTVTAFLYSGFGGRPFWNTAILAPRFLVSAFASGPALLIIALTAVSVFTTLKVKGTVFDYLRKVMAFTLPLNFFLLGCEIFGEFYTNSTHAASAHYMFFGLHGHAMIAPYIWSGLIMNLVAMIVVLVPGLYQNKKILLAACGLCAIGVWTEKGMGLIIPGFIPSPAGDLVEYAPSMTEFVVSLGIWCLGLAIFTMMAKVATAIISGDLRSPSAPS